MAKDIKVGDRVTPNISFLHIHYGIMDVVEVTDDYIVCSGSKGSKLHFKRSESNVMSEKGL